MRMDSTDGASSAPKSPCSAAGADQHERRLRRPADGRGQGEADDADHQRPLGPDHVADAPAEQQEAAEAQACRRSPPTAGPCWRTRGTCCAEGRAMIMMVVSSTTISCAPAMMTRIHKWARLVALSGVPAPLPCNVVTGALTTRDAPRGGSPPGSGPDWAQVGEWGLGRANAGDRGSRCASDGPRSRIRRFTPLTVQGNRSDRFLFGPVAPPARPRGTPWRDHD